MEEIWVKINGYEYYFVSNKGNVKNLKSGREKTLKPWLNNGYLIVQLSLNGKSKKYGVHQLVAIGFLNHSRCGLKMVVNHINFNRIDNRVENLEVVTQRENSNKKHLNNSSKFVGVIYNKKYNYWISNIWHEGSSIFLGTFKSEKEASVFYENALFSIANNLPINKKIKPKSSKFKGVSWYNRDQNWRAYIYINRKCIHLGYFSSEIDASNAYQNELKRTNHEYSTKSKWHKRNSEDIHSSLRK